MKINCIEWDNIANDWNKFSTDAYKCLLLEIKERFYEYKSESENMTEKGHLFIKILSIELALSTVFSYMNRWNIVFILILALMYSLGIIISSYLARSKETFYPGTPGRESFTTSLDPCSKEEKEIGVYYTLLLSYQSRIDAFKILNEQRAKLYNIALYSTIACSILAMAISFFSALDHLL